MVVANWRAFVLIQAAAALVVVAYYVLPGVPAQMLALGHIKEQGGLAFAAISTALAGAILPMVARRLTGLGKGKIDWADFAFQLATFALIGITVDLLYSGLAQLFGNVASPAVVLKKVLVDQLLYTPFISMPISTSAFLWKDAGFSLSRTIELGRGGVWAARYASLLITCWGFWLPVLACVYAMPTNLQFCLFLCAQGAWGLLLLAISGR